MKLSAIIITVFLSFVTGAVSASEFQMPFGLGQAPGARLLVGTVHDGPSGEREESISRLGTKDSLQASMAFYKNALEEAGFSVSLPSEKEGYIAISAKRDRDRIRVSVKSQGSFSDPGENEITIVANYDKP